MKPSLSTIALILLAGGVAVTAAAGPSLAREGEVAATVSGAPVTPAELDKRIGNRLLPMFAEAGEVNCVRALLEKNPSWLNVSDSEYGHDPAQEVNTRSMGLCQYSIPLEKYTGDWIRDLDLQMVRPYYETLRREFIVVSDETLRGSGVIQYVPVKKLLPGPADKQMTMPELAKLNGFFACVGATINDMRPTIGWNKKLQLGVTWKVITSSGYEVKIKTHATSKNTYGKFPDPADPKLKPVWIDLARENTARFLERVADVMKDDKNLR